MPCKNENNDWTITAGPALVVLERWRPLIEAGAVQLLPVYEVCHRHNAGMARMARDGMEAVQGLLSADPEIMPITSLVTAGGFAKLSSEAYGAYGIRYARHVSWIYSRETIVCAESGALYAPDDQDDRQLMAAIADWTPLANSLLTEVAAELDFPGFEGIALDEVVKLRQDSAAFAEVRSKLRNMIENAPLEMPDLTNAVAADYMRSHLDREIDTLRAEVENSRIAGGENALISIGLQSALSGLTGGPVGAAASAITAFWCQNRPKSPDQRASLWIARHIRGHRRGPG